MDVLNPPYTTGDMIFQTAGVERMRIVGRDGRIVFLLSNGAEIVSFETDGTILVRGDRVEAKDVVAGFRAWLASMKILPDPSAAGQAYDDILEKSKRELAKGR